jgi:hypothetical protein
MSSRGGGYGRTIDVKADFRMWRGEKIPSRHQQRVDLQGQRQGVPGMDQARGFEPAGMPHTAQSAAGY